MIDRALLKSAAKQSISGKKPSVFLVAALYILIITVLAGLVWALLGYNRAVAAIGQILLVTPVPTYSQLAAVMPPVHPVAVLLTVAIWILRVLIDVGYMGYCLRISRNEEADYKTIFDSFSLSVKILWLELLQVLIIAFWSFLFVIPGIIAYYRYRLAFYILLDNPEAGAISCLRASRRMMDGNKAELFFLDLSFFGWFFMDYAVRAALVFRLFYVWLAPYFGVTQAEFYNLLTGGKVTVENTGS